MKKHRVEKFLSSIFGTHIGHEHSEVIEGKEGIESKIDKILKLLKSEEKNDDDLEIGSELVSLVEEFYDQYKTLYGKYDSLVEKLKKHTHHKEEANGDIAAVTTSSDSDSSSSDSDRPSKSRKKHGEDNGVKTIREHISMQDFRDMKTRVEMLEKRNGDLESEAAFMLLKIEEHEDAVRESARKEAVIAELEEELGKINESSRKLEVMHEGLKEELEYVKMQHSDGSCRLASTLQEKEALLLEKSHVEDAIRVLKSEKDSLKDVAFKLQEDNQILKQDLESSSKQVVDLKGQLMLLSEESSGHARESSRREADIVELEGELGKTKESMSFLEALHGSLRQELEDLQSQHSDVSLRLTSSREEKEALLLEKLLTENAFEELKAEKGSLEVVHFKLQSDHEILKQELESSMNQAADLNAQLVILNEEKDRLSSEHAHEFARRESIVLELEEELGRTKAAMKNLEEVHESLRQELEDLNSQHSDVSLRLASTHEEKEALLLVRSHTENSIEELKSEKSSLEDVASKLRNENQILKQDLENLCKQVADLNSQLVILNEEKYNLSSDHARESARREASILELEEELERIKESHASARQELEALTLQHSDISLSLQSAREEKEAVLSEKSLAESSIEELKSEKSALEEVAFELRNEIKILKEDLEISRMQIAELNSQLVLRADLEKELSVLKDENSALESEIVRFRAQFAELETVNDELRSDREQLKDTEEKLLRTNANLNENLRSKDVELNHASLSCTEAVEKLRIAEERIEMLNADLERLIEIKSRLSDDHEALKHETETVVIEARGLADRKAQENTDLVARNELLKLELEDSRGQILRLNEDLSVWTVKCSELESESEEAKETIDRLTTDMQMLREAESKLLADIAKLERKIEQRDEDNYALSWKYTESVDLYRYADERIRMLSEDLEKQRITMSQLSDDYEGMKEDFIAADGRASELDVLLAAAGEEKLELEELADELKNEAERLNRDNSELRVGINKLSKKLEAVSNEQIPKLQQVKEALEKQLSRVDDVRVLCLETCGRLHSRISVCSEEIRGVRERTRELISEKEESATKLKEEVGGLRAELEWKAGEACRLAKSVDGYEKAVPELRAKIAELEKETAFKDEEKREVIRQLCVLIDYHRENCEHLYRLLPTRSNGKAV